MPFGGESVEDTSPVYTFLRFANGESPMPFGGESVEDKVRTREAVLLKVTSPMPFGGESVEDLEPNTTCCS